MLPKLVAFDVDGTLISFDGECSDRTRQVIADLRDAGVVVTLSTGRPIAAVPETIALTGPVDYAVCSNGAIAVDLANGDLIHRSSLHGDTVHRIVTGMRASLADVGVAFDIGDAVVEEPGFHRRILRQRPAESVPDALAAIGYPTPDLERIVFFHDDYDDDLPGLASIVRTHLDATTGLFHGTTLPIVDVHPAGLDKSVGLAALAAHLGIDAADTIAFGDGTNDLGMFEWVGTAVAMGDSRDALVPLADHMTGTVADDGVAAYLEPLLAQAAR